MKKTIAFVAHDTQKKVMASFVKRNKKLFSKFNLVGTQGTAKAIYRATGLKLEVLGHGPDGGDVIVASKILDESINVMFFFIDARTPHGHEHDIQTLIRMAVIKNIPVALNQNTAEFLVDEALDD
ncbi:methylglyoxal synthase [Candidatus Pacearchaeota archaeon]|nr:methylglyoxal synthase [Candidatus Pacearchaeota archaeon]